MLADRLATGKAAFMQRFALACRVVCNLKMRPSLQRMSCQSLGMPEQEAMQAIF